MACCLAVSLAAVHPIRGRGPVHAHVPGQERADEQHLVALGILEVDQTPRVSSTGAASSSPSSGSRRRSSPCWSPARWPRSIAPPSKRRGISAPSRLRILFEIVCRRYAPTLVVGLILSFVTMMSVLSVPLMISGESPTMMTVDMAYRINNYGDYGIANALGFISYLLTGLRLDLSAGLRERAAMSLGHGRWLRRRSSSACWPSSSWPAGQSRALGRWPSSGISRTSCRSHTAPSYWAQCSSRAATRSRRS